MQYLLSRKHIFYMLLMSIPIVLLFIVVVKAAINFPIQDDYNAILKFLISYESAASLSGKLASIIKQHNEHSIVFGKLITLAYYKIVGCVNFIHLIIIGNISLLGIAAVLFKSLKTESMNTRLLVFIPVTIFLFNFRYHEASCWAMASLQNIWVLLFAFLGLYFLLNDKKQSIALSIFFATLATFTSGNGILTFVAGIIMLLLRKDSRKILYLFTLAFVFNVVGFIASMDKNEKKSSLIDEFMLHAADFFLYPLNFIGSIFYIEADWIKYLIAIAVLVIAVLIFVKKIYKENYFLASLLLFLILTVGIVSISRFRFGADQAEASRYVINSTLIYIILGLILYQLYYKKMGSKYSSLLFISLVALSVIFNANGYIHNAYRVDFAKGMNANVSLINHGGNMEYNFLYQGTKLAPAEVLSKANEIGIFKTNPMGYHSQFFLTKDTFQIDTVNTRHDFYEFDKKNDSTYVVSGWCLINNTPSYGQTIAIGLEDSLSNLYMVTTQTSSRRDVTEAFIKENCNYDMSGFIAKLRTSEYPKGTYKVRLLIMNDRVRLQIPLNKTISR